MKLRDINYDRLPDDLREGMQRYIDDGYIPGHFLTAVLENDLSEAVGRADPLNLILLPAIVQWVYNEAPADCWGSRQKVLAWHDRHFHVCTTEECGWTCRRNEENEPTRTVSQNFGDAGVVDGEGPCPCPEHL